MDHNPLHGGQFFMAANNYHHLEGALPNAGEFRLYVYDDFKQPVDPRNFGGDVVFEAWNAETENWDETRYPMAPAIGSDHLVSEIPGELPSEFFAHVWLAGEQQRYDFYFEETTVEPVGGASRGGGAIRAGPHSHERPPMTIPEYPAAIAALMAAKRDRVRSQIENGEWLTLYVPRVRCEGPRRSAARPARRAERPPARPGAPGDRPRHAERRRTRPQRRSGRPGAGAAGLRALRRGRAGTRRPDRAVTAGLPGSGLSGGAGLPPGTHSWPPAATAGRDAGGPGRLPGPLRAGEPFGSRPLLACLVLAVGCAPGGGPGETPAPRPEAEREPLPTWTELAGDVAADRLNVVLVTIDTLRADRLSSYGSELVSTPHMDRLAREGVRFSNAATAVPFTLPAHASIMTGTYPPFHGVRENVGYSLDETLPTLAEELSAGGWDTAGFVSAFVLDSRWGIGRGFDRYRDDFQLDPNKPSVNIGQVQHEERTRSNMPWPGSTSPATGRSSCGSTCSSRTTPTRRPSPGGRSTPTAPTTRRWLTPTRSSACSAKAWRAAARWTTPCSS